MSQRAFIGLLALGPLDPEILRRLRRALTKIFALPVKILRPRPVPPQTFHIVRGQHHSTQILEHLLSENDTGAFRLLGVTAVDLYIPILTFVFGEAQLNGKAAVISLFRPRGDADGSSPDLAVVLKRLLKLSAHELGHTFGLGHCREEGCLMGFAANLEKLDQKNLALCRYCQVLLGDFFQDQGITPRFKRYEGTPAPNAAIPVADSGRRRRR
ncbi:MAG: archemetzincin [Deltaproteobacteria bacterium]|nr:archemetzincin [Deltaproteobacteria bacterium]